MDRALAPPARAASVLAALVVATTSVLAHAQEGSISLSVGTVSSGGLLRGVRLPPEGPGYRVLPDVRGRRRTYATAELVGALRRAARRVAERHPGSLLGVADASQRGGGSMTGHRSHHSGRDVDLAFYTVDRNGRPVRVRNLVGFDRNLRSIVPPGPLRFDLARNWELVQALLADPDAAVQFVFVAGYLREQLLAYATAEGREADLVRRAENVLRARGTARAHYEHFHVRVYCAPDDRPMCVDRGRRWPWVSPQN